MVLKYRETLAFQNFSACFTAPAKSQFSTAQVENFSYNPDMTQAAKDFVKTVCGVDCSAAAVSAYGYRNKVCVALERPENEIFLVSFHYKDLNPVGLRVAFDKSLVEKTMELEKARLLYLMSIPEKE